PPRIPAAEVRIASVSTPGVPMAGRARFPAARLRAGMYESFYLRVVSPDQPLGVWIRNTVHKRPGRAPQGAVWCTVFDATRGAPFMCSLTTERLTSPPGGWIELGEQSEMGPGL